VAELIGHLGRSDPEQRRSRIEGFVAGHEVAELQDMLLSDALADEKSALALPEDVSQAMLRRLARDDAPWTGDYLQVMHAGTFRGELLGTVMAEWGGGDLSAAVDWAQKLDERSLREEALVHLSYRWFEADPDEALAYAALHPTEHRQLLTTLVGQWSRQQPEAAAAWAAELFSEPAMAGVATSAIAAWAIKDDLAAAEFVLGLPGGKLRDEASIAVMSVLARNDPSTGALWATSFPAGSKRDYAIENLVYNWATSDPTSALTWSSRLPTGERDLAIHAGAGGLIDTQPALAASWAMTIQDEGRRVQQAERAARRWLETDRWAAEAWIRQSILPPETKLLLLAAAPSGP
jgi:hypothetical protein